MSASRVTVRFTLNGSIVEIGESGELYNGPADDAALIRSVAEKVARAIEGSNSE